jgi:hypothetical protein
LLLLLVLLVLLQRCCRWVRHPLLWYWVLLLLPP